jgi:hypothetical protein
MACFDAGQFLMRVLGFQQCDANDVALNDV